MPETEWDVPFPGQLKRLVGRRARGLVRGWAPELRHGLDEEHEYLAEKTEQRCDVEKGIAQGWVAECRGCESQKHRAIAENEGRHEEADAMSEKSLRFAR